MQPFAARRQATSGLLRLIFQSGISFNRYESCLHIWRSVVTSLFVLYAGYKAYRHYYPAPANPSQPKANPQPKESPQARAIRLDFKVFGKFLPREFNKEDISLFTEEELNFLAKRQERTWFRQNEEFLQSMYFAGSLEECRFSRSPLLTQGKSIVNIV